MEHQGQAMLPVEACVGGGEVMRSSFRVPTEAPASNKMPNSAFPIDLKEHQRDYCDVTPSARPPLS